MITEDKVFRKLKKTPIFFVLQMLTYDCGESREAPSPFQLALQDREQ